jgi:hypothetical protein
MKKSKKKELKKLQEIMKALAKNKKKKKKKKACKTMEDALGHEFEAPEMLEMLALPYRWSHLGNSYMQFPEFQREVEETIVTYTENIIEKTQVRNALLLLISRLEPSQFTELDAQIERVYKIDPNLIYMNIRAVPMFGPDHGCDYYGTVIYDTINNIASVSFVLGMKMYTVSVTI